MIRKLKPWKTNPTTPKDGYITDFRLLTGEFDIIYKVNDIFRKEMAVGMHRLRIIAKKQGFKYANVYDHHQRVQILSYTNKNGIKWLVQRIKDSLIRPKPSKPIW